MKIACICLILALLVSVAWALRNIRERQLLQVEIIRTLKGEAESGESIEPRAERAIVPIPGTDPDQNIDQIAAEIRKHETAVKRKTKNPPSHPLTISYSEAGRRFRVSRNHVRLVALGLRDSKTLSEKLSPYLKHQEDGIGRD